MLTFKEKMKAASKESTYPDIELTDEHLDKLIDIYNGEGYFTYETANGFIAGLVSDSHPLIANTKIALEIGWWVAPEARKTGEGVQLYEYFEWWARDQGCQYILQGKSTTGCRELQRVYIREL